MCLSLGGGGYSAPDTSRQEAEAARQRAEDIARQQAELQRIEGQAGSQRAAEEARFQQQFAEQQRVNAEQARLQQEELARQRAERDRAEAAQRAQAERQKAYQTGRGAREAALTGAIDEAFGGFDDDYFNNFAEQYIGYYKPQIQEQANEAQRLRTLDFAQRGNLDSSAYARALSDLQKRRAEEESRVAAQASDASASFRGQVDQQRQNLLQQALSASVLGDPTAIPEDITQAFAGIDRNIRAFTPNISAGAKVQPQALTPLSNVFADLFKQQDEIQDAGAARVNSTTLFPRNRGTSLQVVR